MATATLAALSALGAQMVLKAALPAVTKAWSMSGTAARLLPATQTQLDHATALLETLSSKAQRDRVLGDARVVEAMRILQKSVDELVRLKDEIEAQYQAVLVFQAEQFRARLEAAVEGFERAVKQLELAIDAAEKAPPPAAPQQAPADGDAVRRLIQAFVDQFKLSEPPTPGPADGPKVVEPEEATAVVAGPEPAAASAVTVTPTQLRQQSQPPPPPSPSATITLPIDGTVTPLHKRMQTSLAARWDPAFVKKAFLKDALSGAAGDLPVIALSSTAVDSVDA